MISTISHNKLLELFYKYEGSVYKDPINSDDIVKIVDDLFKRDAAVRFARKELLNFIDGLKDENKRQIPIRRKNSKKARKHATK